MENPSSQPQYFRFTNESPEAPKPWFRRPETLKRIALIVGVLLVLVFAGIFLSNLIKSMTDAGPRSALEAAREEMAQRQAECDAEDSTCKAEAQKEVARASGVAAACEGLEEKKKENCVTLIAREQKGASTCELLAGDAHVRCTDSVLIARVADGEGMSVCQQASSAKKQACENVVKSTARASGRCTELGVPEEVCNERALITELLRTGNLAGCAELGEEARAECLDLFFSTDTDGDGYSDGTEVQSGYNPHE